MNRFLTSFLGWFGWGGALGQNSGQQSGAPSSALIEGSSNIGPDGAMQLSTVWSCVWLLANTIATEAAALKKRGLIHSLEAEQLSTLVPAIQGSKEDPLSYTSVPTAVGVSHAVRSAPHLRIRVMSWSPSEIGSAFTVRNPAQLRCTPS